MKTKKTSTDLLFEEYLKQRKMTYSFETYDFKGTVPDYIIEKNGKKVLVECEEIESLPMDKTVGQVTSIDLIKILEPLRNKIRKASKQLKPYSGDVDNLIVILGKTQGYQIDSQHLYWAMFGDPVIRLPLKLDNNKISGRKAYHDLMVKGSFRKNKPDTRDMYFPRDYIGGVGLIKSFNGLYVYKGKLFDKYAENLQGDLKDKISALMDFMESGWKKYEKEVPKSFLDDPDKLAYFVDVISNPLSKKPLGKDLFNGKWDRAKFPTVLESINFKG